MLKTLFLATGLCLVVASSPVVKADDVNDLKRELDAQKARTSELEKRIDQIGSTAGKKGSADIPGVLEWASRAGFYGDFRYRYEFIDDDRKTSDQHRNRIRARLGVKAKANDEWDLGLRIATSVSDPVSTNQTLSDSFSGKPLRLDLAFFDYHPEWMKGLNAQAGKIANPFYIAGKNQLIWDHDLTPEGGALNYLWSLTEQTQINLAGGGAVG